MTTLKQDPIDFAGFDQGLVLDETVKESRIYQIDPSTRGDTSLHYKATLEQEIIGYTRMNTIGIEIPTEMVFSSTATLDNPGYYPFQQSLHAEWGLLQWCYQMRILINDVPLEKEEAYRLPAMRASISDYKYDEDDYDILANLGLPYSVTSVNALNTVLRSDTPCLPYAANPRDLREKYERILRGCYSKPLSATITSSNKEYVDSRGTNLTVYQWICPFNQTIPLRFVCRAFRSQALLPPGTRIKIELFAHKFPQIFSVCQGGGYTVNGVTASASWFTIQGDIINKSPFIKYLSLDLSTDLKKQLQTFRAKHDTISFANDLLEEHHVPDNRTKLFNFQLQIQQQFPTHLLFRFTAIKTFAPIYTNTGVPTGRQFFAPTAENPYWKPLICNVMYFADSTCHLGGLLAPGTGAGGYANVFGNDNTIEILQVLKSGKLLIDYRSREVGIPNGNMNTNMDAYIFGLQSKESFTSLNRQGHLKGFESPIGSRWQNGTLSLILHPGGLTDLGVQPGDTNAFNINVKMELSKAFPTPDLLDIIVYIKKPSTFEIDAFDNTYVHMWPEIERNHIWSVIIPKLAN